jgi:predicted regulator of Ras-like GTPase activity (Roadblock/LC7/MglB family)
MGAEALDALGVHFAEIDGVLQVIALRASDVPQVRGEGIDAEALAPLAQSAVRLLGRFGPLRSLVLEHEAGLLFVFPLGRDAIAVLARANVNMGAVFAARAALEEGP